MSRSLNDRRLVLGVTGSVAAYKAVELTNRLKDAGASVSVVMTDASKRFITPLSMQLASGTKAFTGLFDEPLAHISLAREADLLLVAPATANYIGKLAGGVADDLLSSLSVAYRGPVVIAPAMNWRMYSNPVVQRNLRYLESLGVVEVKPEEGRLACGEEGPGRLASIEKILAAAEAALSVRDFEGVKVVVTAGPTREHMDEVRFISNPSTGRMGFALAREAHLRGADVTLISGPTELAPPPGPRHIGVTSAAGMRKEVLKAIRGAGVLIMSAAVSDFAPAAQGTGKPPKSGLKNIKLLPTADILAEVGARRRRPLLVGFAAEAGPGTKRAGEKLLAKNADFMVLNDITEEGSGFGVETNRVTIIDGESEVQYPLMTKFEVAGIVLDRIAGALA